MTLATNRKATGFPLILPGEQDIMKNISKGNKKFHL